MSDQGNAPTGSRLAGMFGFVSAEDRSKWNQTRQINKPGVSGARQGAKGSLDALMNVGRRKVESLMRAQDNVAAQERFEETHARTVNQHWDPKTQTMVENVDWAEKDGRQDVNQADFDLE